MATVNEGRHTFEFVDLSRFCSCVILDVGGSAIHDNFKLLVELQHFPELAQGSGQCDCVNDGKYGWSGGQLILREASKCF